LRLKILPPKVGTAIDDETPPRTVTVIARCVATFIEDNVTVAIVTYEVGEWYDRP
jgi:hypothetical protein